MLQHPNVQMTAVWSQLPWLMSTSDDSSFGGPLRNLDMASTGSDHYQMKVASLHFADDFAASASPERMLARSFLVQIHRF